MTDDDLGKSINGGSITNPINNDSPIYVLVLKYARRVAIVHGVLGFLGATIALYAYRYFVHPAVVVHHTKTPWSESIEAYLFAPSLFQAFFFVGLLYRSSFRKRRVNYPNPRNISDDQLKTILQVVWFGFVAFGVFLFGLTIYHARVVAAGGL